MLTIVCDGTVEVLADGAATCSTGWMTQIATAPFDLSQIDPGVATGLFTGGFVLTVIPWAIFWGITRVLKLLKFKR